MTDIPQSVTVVGIAWYELENYAAIKAAMKDGHLLPPTYSQWRLAAEQAERQARRHGKFVVRAHLDLDTFREFCRTHGKDVDAQGRTDFAEFVAKQVHAARH